MNYIKSCGYSTSWFILHDYHVKLAPSNRQADKQRIELFLLAMKIFLCWWCWAGMCCWIKILLNPPCPLSPAIFWLKHHGKTFKHHRQIWNLTGWWWWCWWRCCWIEIQLNPSCRCQQPSLPRIRLQRLTEFTNIWYFFWNTLLYCTVMLFTWIHHNEIHNLKCASVLKSNCIRSFSKCTITPTNF